MAKVTVQVLDGARTIGGSKVVLRDGETSLLLDFGSNYNKQNRYFEYGARKESFDRFRALGLLPRLDGKPNDHEKPDPNYIDQDADEHAKRIDAVFLSHAHGDHDGHVRYLSCKIPIYGSSETFCFHSSDPRRTYHRVPVAAIDAPIQPKKHSDTVVEIGSTTIEAVPVDHSMPGACAFFITCSNGKRIVYTGDFRLHGTRETQANSDRFVERLKIFAPHLMITEGTNIKEYGSLLEEPTLGKGSSRDRGSVESFLQVEISLTLANGGMVLLATDGKHVERIQTVFEVVGGLRKAGMSDATLLLSDYNARTLAALCDIQEDPREPKTLVYDQTHIVNQFKTADWVHVYHGGKPSDLGIPAERMHTLASLGEPGCALRRHGVMLFYADDIVDLPTLAPPRGSKFILSESEPYDEEQRGDHDRMMAWLEAFGVSYHHIHTSGHVYGTQLKQLIAEVAPAKILPVHTEHPEMFQEILGESRCFIVENGHAPIDLGRIEDAPEWR